MAYATEIRTTSLRDRVSNLFEGLAERRAKAAIFRNTRAELKALSDRELADLGIARSEITSIAFEAAYGDL